MAALLVVSADTLVHHLILVAALWKDETAEEGIVDMVGVGAVVVDHTHTAVADNTVDSIGHHRLEGLAERADLPLG